MARVTKSVLVCDHCNQEIDTGDYSPWVDAMSHGVTLHLACARSLDGVEMIHLLGIDDIKYSGGALGGQML